MRFLLRRAAGRLRSSLLRDPLSTSWPPWAFGLRALWYQRTGRAVVAVVDLDRFIYINDRHGILVGDDVLAAVARQLRPLCPGAGGMWRRGDDFYRLLADVELPEAVAGLHETLEAIESRFSHLPSSTCTV